MIKKFEQDLSLNLAACFKSYAQKLSNLIMPATDAKQQFKDLLRELFQLNNTDLDFGVYRILNIQAKEIEDFINKQLDERVEAVKVKLRNRQSGDVTAELEKAKTKLEKDFGIDFSLPGHLETKAAQYAQLPLFQQPFRAFNTAKEKLDNLRVSEDTERAVYNELYRFFERYYEGGDFISKPRAGKGNYAIPYEGEEVKLYWANYDQYYIKTGDNFKSYAFNNEAKDPAAFTQIEFKILDAEVALNNNKEEKGRLFVPAVEPFEWLPDSRKLVVKFYYRVPTADEKKNWGEKQSVKKEGKGINQKLAGVAAEAAAKTGDAELLLFLNRTRNNGKGEAMPLFLYHLERYTAVNKFDYFIHKDLRGFLRRELDTFLKNDVLSIRFLDPDWAEAEVQEAIKNNVLKCGAIRDIALTVIDFVGELEDFQKRLFEKKKFVVQSHYCLTLDRIPADVYDEVMEAILTDADRKQIKDWTDLKFIEGTELAAGAGTQTVTAAKDFLKARDKLVLDTKHLPEGLKWKLLAAIENLDEATNGLLLCSDNLQALNFIERKFKGKISASYIDPPYNTGDDGFPYKDGFKSSSWITMIQDRLKAAKRIISRNGLQFIHIDFHELNHLYQLCGVLYGEENFISMFNVKVRHESRILKADKNTHEIIEQVLAFKTSMASKGLNKKTVDNTSIADYVYEVDFIDEPDDRIEVDGRTVEVFLKEKYRIKKTAAPSAGKTKSIDIRGTIMQGNSTGRIYTNHLKRLKYPPGTVFKVLNMGDDNLGYRAIKTPEGDKKNATYYQGVPKGKEDTRDVPYCTFLDYEKSFNNARKEAPVDFNNGKKPIEFIQNFVELSCRSDDDTFLDFFGGSGSFGHAIINYNKEKQTKFKFVVVEMGGYFDTTTLPTIKKAAFSTRWEDQKPLHDGGLSTMFQYIKLEQYEDSLNNIEISSSAPQLGFLDNIRYQLLQGTKGSDSLLNLQKFTKPFSYAMKVVQQNEAKEDTPIDLITTFNFLLGIEVAGYCLAEEAGLEYRIVKGRRGAQSYRIVWRPFDEATIDLKAEKAFVAAQPWYDTAALIYCNGDNAFGAQPIEPEFIRLLTEPVL